MLYLSEFGVRKSRSFEFHSEVYHINKDAGILRQLAAHCNVMQAVTIPSRDVAQSKVIINDHNTL